MKKNQTQFKKNVLREYKYSDVGSLTLIYIYTVTRDICLYDYKNVRRKYKKEKKICEQFQQISKTRLKITLIINHVLIK